MQHGEPECKVNSYRKANEQASKKVLSPRCFAAQATSVANGAWGQCVLNQLHRHSS